MLALRSIVFANFILSIRCLAKFPVYVESPKCQVNLIMAS